MIPRLVALLVVLSFGPAMEVAAEVEPALDGPRPRSPEESARAFRLAPGFRIECVASEPLITEPSGVCWDERGRMYVCELHGYNLEGQYDIEALNRTGKLDREVRRIQADDRAKEAARAGTYGTLKRLEDVDGDGRMDRATVFADRLPPAYGMAPARGGLIVACAPDIVFLADRDGDGRAEVREVLFTGFATGALERGINAPQWGLDNWIYFGRGHGGGRITGPHLAAPVDLGSTDFRIRPDGTAIESVTGSTHTFGFAFTAGGDRFVGTTSVPGIFVTPLPWHYLLRNPEAAFPRLEESAADYTRVFPTAPPHPWRTKRAEDPGFFKYYRDRYGVGDSDAGGYFTSGCSPLVYQDVAFPEAFRGGYFMCEPAQNLVHRAVIETNGPALRLRRPPGEEASEFLVSSDPWFHPMHLVHGPEGAVYIVDFYREIIEDYSAIPRYLQQQYGLTNGMAHGRIWRLTHESAPRAPSANLAALGDRRLVRELASPHFWRRQTARRLLVERGATGMAGRISRLVHEGDGSVGATLAAWFTLDGLDRIREADLRAGLADASPEVRRQVLRLADARFGGAGRWVEEQLLTGAPGQFGEDPRVVLQVAVSLGESRDARVAGALARLARERGEVRWMEAAVLSSAHRRELEILAELAGDPGRGVTLLEPLVAAVAARGDRLEITATRAVVARDGDRERRELFGRILDAGLAEAVKPAALGVATAAVVAPSAEWTARMERELPRYLEALKGPRDAGRGRELFGEHCSGCHVAKGVGVTVGPSLDAEFQRAEETILRDILFPSEALTAGFETRRLELRSGESVPGILAGESPTSVTLRLPGGGEQTWLRKRLRGVRTEKTSLMPAGFGQVLEPRDVADLIEFVRAR